MPLIQFDMSEIAELATQVASYGAVALGEMHVDDVFDVIGGIVVIVVQSSAPIGL